MWSDTQLGFLSDIDGNFSSNYLATLSISAAMAMVSTQLRK